VSKPRALQAPLGYFYWQDLIIPQERLMTGDARGLIELIIYLLLGGLLLYIVFWILGMLTLPQQVKTIILIIVAVIVLLWLLSTFGIFTL
jgi:hypothetical protein